MVLGIGTDILKMERILALDLNRDESFFQRTFTSREYEQAMEYPEPMLFFATRFAGKEAVFKSLGVNGDTIRLNEIEILSTPCGQPQVQLRGKLKEITLKKGIKEVQISLSSDSEYAVAFAVAQS